MVEINELLRKSKIDPMESILILSHLLNVDKSYIFTYGDREIDDSIGEEFLTLVEKRYKGYPIHYILGKREFMGLDFYLEEGVLIPRPDTEILVDYTIGHVKEKYSDEKINILDIGHGSGAISLSLAYYLKDAFIYGVDISHVAFKVANENKRRLNISNVKFFKGDLFQALKEGHEEDEEKEDNEKNNKSKDNEDNEDNEEKYKDFFTIITSNPPYIQSDIINTLETQVKDFEPRLALDGGKDGLDFYREITTKSKYYIKKGGLLIYEIGYDQGKAVKKILISNGFKNVEIIKDLQKHDRVALGFK